MAGIDWNRAWQAASRWIKQGTGLLLMLPAAMLLGVLPVLCAFAASRDPDLS